MERQVNYNWLPEEALAVARRTFAEDVFDLRTLFLVLLPLCAFFVWQFHVFDPHFYTYPMFYVVLLSPLPFYAIDYRRYTRKALSIATSGSEVGSPAVLFWDMKGLGLSGQGSSIRLDWSTFKRMAESATFIKLYHQDGQRPMYVLKRPFSDAQLEDFRMCASVISPEGATFL